MFRNDNKHGASKSNIKITNDEEDDEEDDDAQLPITIPTISKAKPPVYSEWIDWCEIKIKFKENVGFKRDVTGKLKDKDIRKKKVYARGDDDMVFMKSIFVDLANEYHNFEITTIYGANLNLVMCLIITLKGHPQYIIKRLPKEAGDLDKITNAIKKTF